MSRDTERVVRRRKYGIVTSTIELGAVEGITMLHIVDKLHIFGMYADMLQQHFELI